jgi:transposase-like protein
VSPADAACSCPHEPGPVPGDVVQLVIHLYVCQGLSTHRIGQVAGMNRQRVGRMLARAGVPVKPRGEGRPRPRDETQEELDRLMGRLYQESGLSSAQISALLGVSDRTVRGRLRASGVRMRTRGRLNREDRVAVPAEALLRLYVGAGLSASDTGRLLGVSRQIVLRTAHDEGIPVRVGGPEPARGPAEIELIEALYADPLVRQALSRHGIALRPAAGPIWFRFPVPLPLTPELAEELYLRCGLAARHVELLTGQPSQTVLRLLATRGITRRPAGGRSPFMRRWRAEARVGRQLPLRK